LNIYNTNKILFLNNKCFLKNKVVTCAKANVAN